MGSSRDRPDEVGTSLGIVEGPLTSGLERLQVGGLELSVLSRGSLEGSLESNADDKTEVVLMRLFLFPSHPPPAERAAWESPRDSAGAIWCYELRICVPGQPGLEKHL